MSSSVQIKTSEEFVSLSSGKVFLRWDSPRPAASGSTQNNTTDPVILLLHGATVPNWQFDCLVPSLLERMCKSSHGKMYRTLRIDLYGHGRSSRPDVEYDLNLFVNQVCQVLDALNLLPSDNNQPAMIGIGHSMGSPILTEVASLYPRLFQKIVLVAPMLDYMALQPHSRLLRVPLLGESLMRFGIVPKLKERRRKRYGAIGKHHLADRFVKEVESKRMDELPFSEVLLRMFRDGAVGDQTRAYVKLGEILHEMNVSGQTNCDDKLKVLVLWGTSDTVADKRHIARILCLLGNTELDKGKEFPTIVENSEICHTALEGLEHNLLMSHWDLCAEAICEFLERTPCIQNG